MMLTMGAGDGIPYGSWGDESYGHGDEIFDDEDDYDDDASEEDYDGSDVEVDDEAEDAFDVHAHGEGIEDDNRIGELDPSSFSSDEAYARALQDAEEREMAARMLALSGISESKNQILRCLVHCFNDYHFYRNCVIIKCFW